VKKNFVKVVIVPPNHTKDLQLLDKVANSLFKAHYRRSYHHWVQNQIMALLNKGENPEKAHVRVRRSDINPELPGWAANAWNQVSSDTLKKGWESIKIHQCWSPTFQHMALNEKKRLYPETTSASQDQNAQQDSLIQTAPSDDYYEMSVDDSDDGDSQLVLINEHEIELVLSTKEKSMFQQLQHLPQSRERRPAHTPGFATVNDYSGENESDSSDEEYKEGQRVGTKRRRQSKELQKNKRQKQ